MSNTLQARIVKLFLPFFSTERSRRDFMIACWPDDPLPNHIDSSGTPKQFVEHFVNEVIKAGRREQKQYVEEALNHIDDQVGVDKQNEIKGILRELHHAPTKLSTLVPYKGLKPYEETDQAYFFGRQVLTEQLADQIESWEGDDRAVRFLAVVGASGSGKSSLVKAGVVPELKRREYIWQFMEIRPGNDPLFALATQLVVGTQNSVIPSRELAAEMLQNKTTLHQLVELRLENEWSNADGVLLVVDQFEELLVPLKGEEAEQTQQRRAFIDNLLFAAGTMRGPIRVIITLRADFYQYCAEFDNLRELLATQQTYIGSISIEELTEIIEEPPKQAEYKMQVGLTDVILDDLGAIDGRLEPGFLPLLSHALLKTWTQRRYYTLMLEDYIAAGGVKGALRETADQVYQGMSDKEEEVARHLFIALTELGEDTADTRRRMKVFDLQVGWDPTLFNSVKNKLTQARLVVFDDQNIMRPDTAYAEITHEALIREWDTLREWLNDNRRSTQIIRRAERSAKIWEENNKEPSFLHQGLQLTEAQRFIDNYPHMIQSDALVEFLKESAINEESKLQRDLRIERRTRRYLLGIIVVLTILLIIAANQINEIRKDRNAWIQARKVNLVRVPNSKIDFEQYEVTNQRYKFCVEQGPCSEPSQTFSTYDENGTGLWPVTGINAFQALVFCEWIDRRLPSKEEWELAASQGGTSRWPWGDLPLTTERVNMRSADVLHGAVLPVGSKPLGGTGGSIYGIQDLIGNVSEWTITTYEGGIWEGITEKIPDNLMVLGGSFTSSISISNHLENGFPQTPVLLDFRESYIGFRCVLDSS